MGGASRRQPASTVKADGLQTDESINNTSRFDAFSECHQTGFASSGYKGAKSPGMPLFPNALGRNIFKATIGDFTALIRLTSPIGGTT